jgi:heat shock protein HslJ
MLLFKQRAEQVWDARAGRELIRDAGRPSETMRRLFVAALVLALGAACGSGASAPAANHVGGLHGASWRLVSIHGNPALAGGSLRFDDGRLSGSTGCNTFGGTYEQSGASLSIGVGQITLIGCTGPLGKQETAVLAALGKTAAMRTTDTSLTLLGSGGAGLLIYHR